MKAQINAMLQRKRIAQISTKHAVDSTRGHKRGVEPKDGYDWLSQIKQIPSRVNHATQIAAHG